MGKFCLKNTVQQYIVGNSGQKDPVACPAELMADTLQNHKTKKHSTLLCDMHTDDCYDHGMRTRTSSKFVYRYLCAFLAARFAEHDGKALQNYAVRHAWHKPLNACNTDGQQCSHQNTCKLDTCDSSRHRLCATTFFS